MKGTALKRLSTRSHKGSKRASIDDPLMRLMSEETFRDFRIENINKDERTIELAFSSDIELERWPGIVEQLSHAPGACDLKRLNSGANLLFNHDADEYRGVIENARIDADGKGRAKVRFGKSERAEEVWKDVQDGILRNVSVGYRIKEVKLVEERENGPDVYLVTRWEPFEISIVTIPADTSVGVGRTADTSANTQLPKSKILMNREQMLALLARRGITVNDDVTDADLVRMVTESEPQPPKKKPEITVNAEQERAAGRQTEQERVRTILAAGKRFNMPDIAQSAIEGNKSIDETRELMLEELNKRNTTVAEGSQPIGLTDQEAQQFSFTKLIRALCAEPNDKRSRTEAKFEIEACQAAADRIKHRSVQGTVIPVEVLLAGSPANRGTNTISIAAGAGYTGTGGNTVATTLLASSFIDLLRNKTVLMQLGTELAGLVGNIDIPKQTTGTTGAWIGEDGDAGKTDFDFGMVQLRPKTVAGYGEITRKMLMQSSLGVEALLRADLARALGLTIDLAGFYADGTGNAPTGVKETNGVNVVDFAAANPTFAELVQMETEIATDNADIASMIYVFNAKIRGYAKTTRRIATSTDSQTIWEPGNTINGYPTNVTNQVADGDIFFGNWADLLIGLWGGLEITVDPYTHSTKGRIRIVAMQDVDYTIRRPQSFCYGNNNP